MFRKIQKDELVRGSIILFIMINLFNFLNYVFHFSMARLLGPADYGILAVLMSVIYIFTIPSEAIQNITTKYTSRFSLHKEFGKIKFMLFKILKRSIIFSIFMFLLFIPISVFLGYFLEIDYFLFIYTGILIFFIFSVPMLRGVLQGMKKFSSLGFSMVLEGVIKVGLAIVLVFLGWKVYGAISAILLSVLFTFVMIFLFIKPILISKTKKEDFSGIYSYSIPFFVSILAIVLVYSLDIILAKRFFSPEIAGKYAVASMLGKMIYFGTFAISKAMFPLTSEKYENGRKTSSLLGKSLKIVALLSGIALVIYLLFPKLVISIFFGSQYIGVANILFLVGVSLTLLAFSNIFILYGLSINKIKNISFSLLVFVFLEIVLFSLFHSSLVEFVFMFLIVNFLMLIYSIFIVLK